MNNKQRSHLLYQDLSQLSVEVALASGLDAEEAAKLGGAMVDRICQLWGGQLIYLPKLRDGEPSERDWKIYRAFTGDNVNDLVREFKLSFMQIRRILKATAKYEARHRQPELFS